MHPNMTIMAAAAALLAPSAGQAQSPGRAPARSIESTDVAGVRLEMTRQQAEAALAGTYRCDRPAPGLSYAELVQDEVTRRRGGTIPWGRDGSGIQWIECRGPGREKLLVWFAQTPAGPVVREVSLQASAEGLDIPDVRRQLAAKYGRPTLGDDVRGVHCNAGYRCGDGSNVDGPHLSVDTYSGLFIKLLRGQRAQAADDAAVLAAADRIAPKRSGAAF